MNGPSAAILLYAIFTVLFSAKKESALHHYFHLFFFVLESAVNLVYPVSAPFQPVIFSQFKSLSLHNYSGKSVPKKEYVLQETLQNE